MRIIREMGAPVVRPSKTPERISARSSSFLGVEALPAPGLRRFRYGWISSSLRASPAGQPSMTTPNAFPWDSPQVVILKMVPKVEPAIMIPPIVFIEYF